MLEQDSDQLLENAVRQENAQEGLRYLLLMAINLMPYIRQGADAFYQEELVRILQAYIYRFFLNAGNKKDYHPGYTTGERSIVLQYHTYAIMGMLMNWSEDDMHKLDDIVKTIYRVMTEGHDNKA